MNREIFDCDVLVAGAGLSGLACADLLIDAGLEVMVLEAANRTGGRIHSLRLPDSKTALADLGPTWIWPKYQPLITPWLERLEIETFDQFETGDAVFDTGKDQPVHRQPTSGQDGIKRIFGGPQTLIDRLQARLPASCVRIGHCVTAIEGAQEGIFISVRHNGAQQLRRFKARKLVIALPLRVAVETIDWSGGLDQAVLDEMANTPTWMATQAKMVVVYDKPFWRDAGLCGRVASQSGPLAEIHDHCSPDGKQAALFGFVGWPHEMRRLHARELKDLISAQLVRCFGKQAGDFHTMHVEDWAKNPLICSRRDMITAPAHPEVTSNLLRASHYEGRLWFCVAEISQQSPGLIEGALAAAQRTATKLVNTA